MNKDNYKYKTKSELESLSYEEFRRYVCEDFLSSVPMPISGNDKQYLKELEYFELIHFKDVYIARYKRWNKEVVDNTHIPKGEDMMLDEKRFIVKLGSWKQMYEVELAAAHSEVGVLQYII